MIHSLAVTTDFSRTSREAFAVAAQLARKFRASLQVLYVLEEPEIFMPWQISSRSVQESSAARGAAQRRLERLCREEEAFAGLEVKARTLVGESADAVRRVQESDELDLIVIASHGHSSAEEFALGGFTAKILRLASCPVLVLRAAGRRRDGSRLRFAPRRILASHDFSRASSGALEVARSWARAFDGAVDVLFVVETASAASSRPAGAPGAAEICERTRREGESRLRLLVEAADWETVPAKGHARIGHPVTVILNEARRHDADLIVMASHGRSAVEWTRLGSVVERTVHQAPCPVLVVKNPASPGAESSRDGSSWETSR